MKTSLLKKIGIGVFLLVLGISVLLTLLWGYAQTPGGCAVIVRILTGTLNQDEAGQIEFGTLSGSIPWDLRMDRVVLRDGGGPWMTLQDLHLKWSLKRLLNGRFYAQEIRAGRVHWSRKPGMPPSPDPERTPRPPSFPSALLGRIQVDALRIDRLLLDEAVLGRDGDYRVEGRLLTGPGGPSTRASLRVIPREGTGGGLVLEGGLHDGGKVLDLTLEVKEDVGRLLSLLLGARDPLTLSLEGRGPLDGWKGRLALEASYIGRFQGEIGIQGGGPLTLLTRGNWQPPRGGLAREIGLLFGGRSDITLQAEGLSGEGLRSAHLSARGPKGTFELTGDMDPGNGQLSTRFQAALEDLTTLRGLTGFRLSGRGHLQGHAEGRWPFPDVSGVLSLSTVEAPSFQAGALEADLSFGFIRGADGSLKGFRTGAKGTLSAPVIGTGEDFPEERVAWSGEALIPLDAPLSLKEFTLRGDHFSLTLSGTFHGPGGRHLLAADLEVDDTRVFSGITGLEVPLGISAHAEMETPADGTQAVVNIRGDLRGLEPAPKDWSVLLGQGASYAGTLTLGKESDVSLSGILLALPAGTLQGDGVLALDRRAISGTWRADLPRLSRLTPLLGFPLEGSLATQGDLKGTLENMTLTVSAEGRDIRAANHSLGDLDLTLRSEGLPRRIKGHLAFSAQPLGERMSGETALALEKDSIGLAGLSLAGLGAHLTGDLTVGIPSGLILGDIRARAGSLAPLGSLFGTTLEGSLTFGSTWKEIRGAQGVVFSGGASGLLGPRWEARSLEFSGTLEAPFSAIRGRAEVAIEGLKRGTAVLEHLALSGDGSPGRGAYSLRATGRAGDKFKVVTDGTFRRHEAGNRLEITSMEAAYGKVPLRLLGPASLDFAPGAWRLQSLDMAVSGGRFRAGGRMEDPNVDFHCDFNALPLGDLLSGAGLMMGGAVSGRLILDGRMDRPGVSLDLEASRIRLSDPPLQDIPPVTLTGRATLRDGDLLGVWTLGGLTARPLEIRVGTDFRLSLHPFGWELPRKGLLRGGLTGEMELAQIATYISLNEQFVSGKAALDLSLSGTVDSPRINGGARLTRGTYEHLISGTVLKDIELTLESDAHRIHIRDLGATDGGKGRIRGNGWIDLLPEEGFPFTVDLNLEHAALIRRDEGTAVLGGGLSIAGTAREALLSGEILLEGAELRIPDKLPAGVSEIEVIDDASLNGRGPEPSGEHSAPPGPEFDLKVKVLSPGRAFLRGRGLDSEWQGLLTVSGSSRAPVITGNLSVVRGTFDFLGKPLDLSNGRVLFDGNSPPSPRIDLTAEASTGSLTAQLILSGPLQSPAIELRSDPPLPSDEILARLLFGRSAAEVSPAQALQLAQAINTLRGGGMDVLGRTRQLLGVDRFEISQGEEGFDQTTVRAGKYLGDSIYLEVERGIGSETGKASVEWELTPNLSVESEAGVNAEVGIGLNWSWDY